MKHLLGILLAFGLAGCIEVSDVAKTTSLQFPFAGIVRRLGYQSQAPYSCFDALNVRPSSTFGNRMQGGSRPGLKKWDANLFAAAVKGIGAVQLPEQATSGAVHDPFSDTGVLSATTWPAAMSDSGYSGNKPTISGGYLVCADDVTDGAVTTPSNVDMTKPMQVSCRVNLQTGASGVARLHALTNVAGTGALYEEVVAELHVGAGYTTGGAGYAKVVLTRYVAGAAEATQTSAEFTLTGNPHFVLTVVPATKVAVVYIDGAGKATITYTTATAVAADSAFGVSLSDPAGVSTHVRLFDFHAGYKVSVSASGQYIAAVSGASLYRRNPAGTWASVQPYNGGGGAPLGLRSGVPLMMASLGSQVYIADYDDDAIYDGPAALEDFDTITAPGVSSWSALGVGSWPTHYAYILDSEPALTGAYPVFAGGIATQLLPYTNFTVADAAFSLKLVRGIRVYDPATASCTMLEPSIAGTFPPGNCKIVCAWNNRLVAAGDPEAPNTVYMSRQGDPTDWNYSAEDAQGAVALTADGEYGSLPEAVTALMPGTADYLLLGTTSGLWCLRGDPRYGGRLDNLSDRIGTVSRFAWCRTNTGEIVFLSDKGVYMVPPGSSGFPILVSQEIPSDLLNLSPATYNIFMAWDGDREAIHLFLVPVAGTQGTHWVIDWKTKSFWKDQYPAVQQPGCVGTLSDTLVLGGLDGYLRQFDDTQATDDGTAISSYVKVGPIRLGPDEATEGIVDRIECLMADDSGSVTYELHTAETAQVAANSTAAASTGTLTENRNGPDYPRSRGVSLMLKLASSARWAMESILLTVSRGGMYRRL